VFKKGVNIIKININKNNHEIFSHENEKISMNKGDKKLFIGLYFTVFT